MFEVRFPEGFVCPKCGCHEYYYLSTRHTCQCKNCRRQTSVTSGTVMHRTHLPLTVWFWAIYLCATDKRGISAKGLARQLDLSYESAWYLSMHRNTNPVISSGFIPQSETSSPFCLEPTMGAAETINRTSMSSVFDSTGDSFQVNYLPDSPRRWLHLVLC